MTERNHSSSDPAELRRRAEERLKETRKSKEPEAGVPGTTEGTRRLIQELQIHQIELEMQNEELQMSRAEVETILDQYTDLYDFAPTGYFTFDREGTIRLVNLTGASLLGIERSRLVNHRFVQFVSETDRPEFNRFLGAAFAKLDPQSEKAFCEVALSGRQGSTSAPEFTDARHASGTDRRYVRMEGMAAMDGQTCHAVMTDITDRKRAEEKIKASLLEKETMLREIHHRVKNNLQVISSLLNMQADILPDEKSRKMFQNSIERVRTMSTIHTQLYQAQDLTGVDFSLIIRDLIANIKQSYGRTTSPVDIKMDIQEMRLGIDNSIPCGLILNELVANALKHAFPEGTEGEINIKMNMEASQMVLTVQDNGIGFPASVDFRNTQSLGMELVNLLVGQVGAAIDMQVDGGTKWTITCPINKEREWRNG